MKNYPSIRFVEMQRNPAGFYWIYDVFPMSKTDVQSVKTDFGLLSANFHCVICIPFDIKADSGYNIL